MRLFRGTATTRTTTLATALALGLAAQGHAEVLITKKDALALAFPPGVAVESRTAYLDAAQVAAAEAAARVKLGSQVWTYYVGTSSAGAYGYAYFDKVVVRTMPAVLMGAVDPQGRLRFLEVLSFEEPKDYLPRRAWLKLFAGRALGPELSLKGAIRNVAGATLTSAALTDSARRILALHRAIHPGGSSP